MKKYAVYSADDIWLFNVHGENEEEALALAKANDPRSAKVTLVSRNELDV